MLETGSNFPKVARPASVGQDPNARPANIRSQALCTTTREQDPPTTSPADSSFPIVHVKIHDYDLTRKSHSSARHFPARVRSPLAASLF